jgi:hypothetical protein
VINSEERHRQELRSLPLFNQVLKTRSSWPWPNQQ